MRRLALILPILILLCVGYANAADERAVTFLVDPDHAPYTYEQDGEFKGVSVSLLQAVFRNTPYRLEFAEATIDELSLLRSHGELDVAGFYPYPSSSGNYIRSDMLFTVAHCLCTRKGYPRVSIANASQEKMGVRSESYLTKLAGSHLGIGEYVTYETVQEGVSMLLARDIDVIFEEEAAIKGALDALGAWDQVEIQQSEMYRTPVQVVLPGELAVLIDELNIRVAQVRASGMAARLLNASEEPDAADGAGGSDAVPFAAIGVLALLFVTVILVTRSITLAPVRAFEALGEAFPMLALNDRGEITYLNNPVRELLSDFKLVLGKRFNQDERIENLRTGLSMDMSALQSESDVLVLKGEKIYWRGTLDVSRVKLGARGEMSTLICFSPFSEQYQQRGFALLNVMMGIQGSFSAFCRGVFHVLEAQILATAMGVYLPNSVDGVEPLFETLSSESALRSLFGKLYQMVYDGGLCILRPDEITELAARFGLRYNEQVRFVAAPLTTDNEMTGMLFLRLRMSANELTVSEREMIRSVAWRVNGALQRFNYEARTRRLAWYDSSTLMPNAAYFEQMLRRLCGESVNAPASIKSDFKKLPQTGSVAIFRVTPSGGGAADAISARLGDGWRAARLNEEMFGLLLDETDIGALKAILDELMNGLLLSLPGGAALSFGAVRFPFDSLSADGLINLARLALAKAKQNEIVIYGG